MANDYRPSRLEIQRSLPKFGLAVEVVAVVDRKKVGCCCGSGWRLCVRFNQDLRITGNRTEVGDCGRGVAAGSRTTLLHCIKSSRVSTGDGAAIVTRAVSAPSDVRCWFFSAAADPAQPEMYWLAAPECGSVVPRRLDGPAAARPRHVAVLLPASRADQLRRGIDHATSTLPPRRHLPADRRRTDDQPRHLANISDDAPTLSPDLADTNCTPEATADSDEEPANVFVVFAAMVIFTLLQIPCTLCQVSA